MSGNQLKVSYRDADLKVEFDKHQSARLLINNISRHEQRADSLPCTLRLTSTVQTAYEWHEFIEAIVHFDEETVSVQLIANNTEVANESFQREKV